MLGYGDGESQLLSATLPRSPLPFSGEPSHPKVRPHNLPDRYLPSSPKAGRAPRACLLRAALHTQLFMGFFFSGAAPWGTGTAQPLGTPAAL